MNLLAAAFNLCRSLQKMPIAGEMHELIAGLTFFAEGAEINRSDFGYLARKQNAQFCGYLFIDEKRDVLNEFYKDFPRISHREKELLATGHAILRFLDDLCTRELRFKYPNIAAALNPYGQMSTLGNLPQVNINGCIEKRDCLEAANAFKETLEHRILMTHPCGGVIKNLSEAQVLKVVNTIAGKITACDVHSAPKNVLDFKAYVANDSKQYYIFKFFLAVMAVREILANLNQLLFKAMIGEPFLTLNNGNILNLEKHTKNVMGEALTVLFKPAGIPYDCMGNIVLMDCRISNDCKIYKFCRVEGTTFSFAQKTGAMQFKMRQVNESLNPFFNLVSI